MGGAKFWAAVLIILPALTGCVSPSQDEAPSISSLPEKLLLNEPYKRVVVDVDHVEGRSPTPEALRVLERALTNETDKEEVLVQPSTRIHVEDTSSDRVWSTQELLDLSDRTLDAPGDGCCHRESNTTLYLQAVYLNGKLPGDHPQGVEIHGTAFLAKDAIEGRGPVPEPFAFQFERAILVHEFGHAMGLVGEIPMQQERLAEDGCDCHSRYASSVMYSNADRTPSLEELTEYDWPRPYHFDRYDKQDIEAFQRAHRAEG